MDATTHRELARKALDGYVHGPAASTQATALAPAKVDNARTLVLVEGISDQIALETAAATRGRDLETEQVVIMPIGGAHAITRYRPGSARWRPTYGSPLSATPARKRSSGTGSSPPRSARLAHRADLEHHGFYVCVNDLEDELLRAVGTEEVEALFDSQGDLGSFRSLQNQPAWQQQQVGAQMRRFLGSGARHKLRYARLLVQAAARRDRLPRPLDALLDTV